MTFKNPYFSSENADFVSVKDQKPTAERMRMIKVNNKFLFTLFSAMRTSKTKEEFTNTKIYQKYKNTFLAGNLFKNDNLTGFNTKKLGEKIKFLVMAFCDESHPENIQKIQESSFMKDIMMILYHGGISPEGTDSDEMWELYEKADTVDGDLKNLSPLNGAVSCYVNDNTMPVGLDFSTLIDGIVKEDEYGNYEIASEIDNLKTNEEMIVAMKTFVDMMKSSEKFKRNYHNSRLVEVEMEDL